MSYVTRHRLTPTTAAGGAATAYTPVTTGFVASIVYTKHATNPYAAGCDFTVTAEESGAAIWTGTDVNATVTVSPRAQVHGTTGTGLVYAGTDAVADRIAVAQERIKLVIAAGGDAKDGTFDIYVEGS